MDFIFILFIFLFISLFFLSFSFYLLYFYLFIYNLFNLSTKIHLYKIHISRKRLIAVVRSHWNGITGSESPTRHTRAPPPTVRGVQVRNGFTKNCFRRSLCSQAENVLGRWGVPLVLTGGGGGLKGRLQRGSGRPRPAG